MTGGHDNMMRLLDVVSLEVYHQELTLENPEADLQLGSIVFKRLRIGSRSQDEVEFDLLLKKATLRLRIPGSIKLDRKKLIVIYCQKNFQKQKQIKNCDQKRHRLMLRQKLARKRIP